MRISCDPRQITVSQTNMAKALNLTQGRIAQLVKDGIMVRDDGDRIGGVRLVESIRNYDKLAAPALETGKDKIDYNTEKAKHEKTKREIAEIQLAKLEHLCYDSRTVELVMSEMLSTLRTQLLGLPSKLAPQMEGMKKEDIYTCLTKAIEECLSELAEYSPDLFAEEVEGGADDEDSA